MAALTITAANVSLVSGAHDADQIAGEAFIAGAAVYKNSTDGNWYKAKCASATADQAGATDLGIALATADAAGARVSIAKQGAIVALGTGTAGTFYAVGATAGAINPVADLATTNKSTGIGIGIGSNQLQVARLYNAAAIVP